MQRYDILAPRPGKNERTFWHRVGTAFEAKDGAGINLIFDSLPIPGSDGTVKAIVRPAKDFSEATDQPRTPPRKATADGIDDDIPF